MVAVELRHRLVALAEDEDLIQADRRDRPRSVALPVDVRRGRQDLAVEAGDRFGRPDRGGQLDIGQAERGPAEARVGLMAADAVAPGGDGIDEVVVLLEREERLRQHRLHGREPAQQRRPLRQHQPRDPAHDLRLAGRQVELAPADVGPHVVDARHQIGVAREAEAAHVVERRQALVGDAGVDVLQRHDIAEVLRRPIEGMLHARGSLLVAGNAAIIPARSSCAIAPGTIAGRSCGVMAGLLRAAGRLACSRQGC